MNRTARSSTIRLSAVRRHGALLAAFALTASVAGCQCEAVAIRKVSPSIKVTPNPIAFSGALVGLASDVIVNVANIGNASLNFSQAPFVVMTHAVSTPVFAVLPGYFSNNCDGSDRNGNNTEILAGGCATLDLRYLPVDTSNDAAVLRFVTNDPANPFDVPIVAQGQNEHVNVCVQMNGAETCNVDGQPLPVDFGAMIAVGSTGTMALELKSSGTVQAQVDTMVLTGDMDFTTTPGAATFRPVNLPSGGTWPFTLNFGPLAGGPRSATLTFTTEDPSNRSLVVNITATGAGPALCYCIGTSPTTCVTQPSADFGNVGTGTTASMYLDITSCGTAPLIIQSVTLASGSPEFAAMNLPSAGTSLAPGSAPINIPLTFTPTAAQMYQGEIVISTTNAGNGNIQLEGNGIVAGCDLSGAATIAFGSVAVGVQAKQTYSVSNRGTVPCTFPQTAAITLGASAKFGLLMFPTTSVPPGGSAVFTATYQPQMIDAGDTGQLSIYYLSANAPTGTAPTTLTVELTGTPAAQAVCQLQATPSANSTFGRILNFGQVNLGTTATLPATFRNTGSAPCTLNAAKLVAGLVIPADIGAFAIKQQPASPIPPGMTATLQVSFTPTAQQVYGSPLPVPGFPTPPGFSDAVQVQTSDTVTFNGADCPTLNGNGPAGCVGWALSGEGVVSDLVVLPTSIDFGQTTLGCRSQTETITLYNIGQTTVTISGFTIDPAPPPTVFSVNAPATPFTIAGGASTTITVQYSPSQLGTETGTLYIDTNASNATMGMNPYISVSLTGAGTSNSQQVDTFTEPTNPVSDVLWVIDQDSNSMSSKIAEVAANAQTFINNAVQQHTDFHLGVVSNYTAGNLTTTTTAIPGNVLNNGCGLNSPNDTCGSSFGGVTIKPGEFYHGPGQPTFISSSDANAVQDFTKEVEMGVCDAATGNETGLNAMYLALSAPNLTGANTGFLRPDARLIVIEISDDDDVPSNLTSPTPTSFYVDFLKSLKPGYPQNVTFDFVGGDMPNGCTNGVDGDAPDRFNQVVQGTGGKLYSICTGNWMQIAADLGLGSFHGQTVFVLSRPCNPATLTVTVNGTMVSMGAGFTFNAAMNSITLATLPPPGATIVATYGTVCM